MVRCAGLVDRDAPVSEGLVRRVLGLGHGGWFGRPEPGRAAAEGAARPAEPEPDPTERRTGRAWTRQTPGCG